MMLRRSLFSAAIVAAFTAQPVLAQTSVEPAASDAAAAPAAEAAETTPAADAVVEFETITVTARKREEKIRDIPVSVSAVSGDMLERQNIVQAKDIAAIVPGLNINSDSAGRSFISMRGIGATLIDTVQPGVGVFIDGVYVPNTSYLNSPLVDISRIEVLRGPQGTLFGQNTLGGAINIITKQPTDEFEGRVTTAYAGPDDYRTVAGSLSGPLMGKTLTGRLGYAYHYHDGFQDNDLAGGEANLLRQRTVNGGLNWQAAPGARISLNGYRDQVDGGITPYAQVAGTKDYQDDVQLNDNKIGNYVYSGVNLRGTFALGDANTLTPMISYDKREHDIQGDGDFGPADFLRVDEDGSIKTKTGEVKLDTKYNEKFSTLFGVFGDRYVNEVSGITTVVPNGAQIPSQAEITTKAYAAYGTLFYNIDETLEATAGIRYDHQKVSSEGDVVGSIKASEWQPRFTLRKHWTDSFMTYGSIARGFRGGGVNASDTALPTYKGDSVWTYELGTKTMLLDDRIALETSVFYNDYKHFIGQNSLAARVDENGNTVGLAAINLNTGDAESYGIESEIHARLTSRWAANAGITLLHARITDGSEYEETTGNPLPTKRVIFTPDWNFNLGTDYTLPLGGDSLLLHAGLVGKGERKGSTFDPDSVPSLEKYFLLDMSATFKRGPFSATLFASNLTNEHYWESYIDKSVPGSVGLQAIDLGLTGDRRRVGLRVGYEF